MLPKRAPRQTRSKGIPRFVTFDMGSERREELLIVRAATAVRLVLMMVDMERMMAVNIVHRTRLCIVGLCL